MFSGQSSLASPAPLEDVVLNAALEASLRRLPSLPQSPDMYEHDTLSLKSDKEKLHSSIDIVVNSEEICLRGIDADVEPALLSGHVVLQLVEPTSIKGITLKFRGKAKLPPTGPDSINLSSAALSYLVCDHEWSFLEGEKNHGHTLKAGRHLFPFHLQIGGSLPSSVSTSTLGGAYVQYKLSAVASRPGLSYNFQASKPILILRAFHSESLEYQQSLEIENTWPGKVMYSLMVPHKAWAAGDKLSVVAKFSPLTKGTKVVGITSSIHETAKLYSRLGDQETSKILVTAKHTIAGGRVVFTEEFHSRYRIPLFHHQIHGYGLPSPPLPSSAHQSPRAEQIDFSSAPSTPNFERTSFMEGRSLLESTMVDEDPAESSVDINEDVVTMIKITIPKTASASQSTEPISLSHRIKWNIMILNPDGHISELRCSLPLHILDYHLLEEAKTATAATRRLLLGELEGTPDPENDVQLPSYPSHIRDRVPDMYSNSPDFVRIPVSSGVRTPASGLHSPFFTQGDSHLPHVPGDSDHGTPLEWVTSELLRHSSVSHTMTIAAENGSSSHPGSRFSSRFPSRAPSPERGIRPGDPPSRTNSSNSNETYFHSPNPVTRNLQTLFQMSLKPFMSLSSPFSLSSRSSFHTHISAHFSGHISESSPSVYTSAQLSPRLFSEVPDYEVASRGFAGGGITPLTTLRGLPSYEDSSIRRTSGSLEVRSSHAPETDS